jgi:hypothetical protein
MLVQAGNSLDTVIVTDDMPNEAYHAERDHISRSTAFRFAGPYGAVAQQYHDRGGVIFSGNASTDFGTAVDRAVGALMSGVDYRSLITVCPAECLTSNGQRRGKAYEQWKQSVPPDAIEVSASDAAKVDAMVNSLLDHRRARTLIESCESTQRSVFWTDADGHRRKARADGVSCGGQWWDLKTTSSEWDSLRYSFKRFGYHWQAAWYLDARDAAAGEPLGMPFPFVVIQSFAPFCVEVVEITDESLARARDEIRETLSLIKTRRETGVYLPDSYHETRMLDV